MIETILLTTPSSITMTQFFWAFALSFSLFGFGLLGTYGVDKLWSTFEFLEGKLVILGFLLYLPVVPCVVSILAGALLSYHMAGKAIVAHLVNQKMTPFMDFPAGELILASVATLGLIIATIVVTERWNKETNGTV